MRKLTIFMMLAIILGLAVRAQAETSVLNIINNMLTAQHLNTIPDQTTLDSFLVSYQTFALGNYTIEGYGKQAGNNQQAYAYQVGSPGTNLFNLGAYNSNSNGELLGTPINFNPVVAWGLKGETVDGTFYSQNGLNSDGEAHWHLYCLACLGQGYNIGFAAYEDRPKYLNGNIYSDFDYNDLVLKISPNPSAAPIPGGLLLLGSGLLRMVGIGTRRKAS